MTGQVGRLRVPCTAYLLGVACTVIVFLAVARSYVPFDRSALVFVHPHLPGAANLQDLFAAATLLWFCGFCALVLVLLAHRTQATPARVVVLVAAQATISLLFVLLPVAIDSDQYAYIGYGYAARDGNAYAPTPISPAVAPADRRVAEHWGDPLPRDRYGGAWTALNALLLAPFAHANVTVQALMLRVAAVVAACTITFVALTFTNDLGALASFALNPLVIVECANGAHNDIFMVLAGCLSFAALLMRRYGLSGVLLGLAASIKFAYAPFLLPVLAFTYRRSSSRRAVAKTAAGMLAVCVLSTAPYGWRHGVLQGVLALIHHRRGIFARVAPLSEAALAGAMGLLAFDIIRRRLPYMLLAASAVLLLSIDGKIEAWYPLMTAPLAFVPSTMTRLTFLALSALGTVSMQSSFSGFPLVEAVTAAIATALVGAVLLSQQPRAATA